MEPKLLFSAPRTSPSTASGFFFPSYQSPLLGKPKLCSKTLICSSMDEANRTPFLGKSLYLRKKIVPLGNPSKTQVPFCPIIRSVVKRRKELPFGNVIQRDKKLNLVLKIRKVLVNQPDRIMQLHELGEYRRFLGLQKGRRFLPLLKKFPAIFEIMEEGASSLRFRMTPEAERLYLEEMRVRNAMEDVLVVKLRRLLMMSSEKRILLGKIAHLRTELGLPLEFQDTICHRYPQYFKVVVTGRGPALELTHWDPELAVSAAETVEEKCSKRGFVERGSITGRPPNFNPVKLPSGHKLSKAEMGRIAKFRDMDFISPYSDFSTLRSGTLEREKHACAVIHEMLSLTIENQTLVDHLTIFRDEFGFPQQLKGMLMRHRDMFYVSLKRNRDYVFLREAYHDSHLIEKDQLVLIREKLRSLVAFPRCRGRGGLRSDENKEENDDDRGGKNDEEDEDEWSEVEDGLSDEFSDEGEDRVAIYEDDWNDGDGEAITYFNEENEIVRSTQQTIWGGK